MRTRTVLRDLPLLALLEQLYVGFMSKIDYLTDLRRVKPETREDNGLCGDPEDCQGCGWCTEEKEIE